MKAILLTDLPKSCDQCRFKYRSKGKKCLPTDNSVDDILCDLIRPAHCPLIPVSDTEVEMLLEELNVD